MPHLALMTRVQAEESSPSDAIGIGTDRSGAGGWGASGGGATSSSESERLYDLVSVVIHCGAAMNRGHYITAVRCQSVPPSANAPFWLIFDDDIVEVPTAALTLLCFAH